MNQPQTVPFSLKVAVRYSGFGAKDLVVAPHLEIENADRLTRPFWDHLNGYLQRQFNILPGSHDCPTLYFDTPKFDVSHVGITLRDRPGALSSDGERFGDEFSVKFRHPHFIEYARQLTTSLYPRHDMSTFVPYIRNEIVENHTHPRDVSKYTYGDFSPQIQAALDDRIGSSCHTMEYWPQVMSFVVPRHRYTIFLDPHDAHNFILPPPAQASGLKSDKHVCVEVAMDKCVYRRPTKGMPIGAILTMPASQAGRFPFLGADYLAEREFKPGLSGCGVTDEMMIAAHARLGMFFYDLAKPFEKKDQPEPIRAVRSKAARSVEVLATKYPHMVPGDLINVCHLIP
jgi:hypothetical protein